MTKPLSQLLADLSVRAKNTEEAWTAAQKEARAEILSRRTQARAVATSAVEKVNKEIESARTSAVKDWKTLKAKVASDITALKADVSEAKHELDVQRAEDRAEMLEWDAVVAVDYAIAAVEQAQLAALDAVDARLAAEEAKQA